MNLQPVSVPPDFAYLCLCCQRRMDSRTVPPIADLDGPAFSAYYCTPCAEEPTHRAKFERATEEG